VVDGSGLAPNNRVTALALVQTLQAMTKHPQADLYRRSLPIGGRSGTLSSRFRGTAAENRVFAKTGTISGVVSLGGYITPRNAKSLVFGIIVNSSSSPSAIRALVDDMVIHLAQLEGGC
jgi:D-alanyl-D-alanine carboxypeptidase/D-alanyl-D-alanine-endopeptidase (penicillin-binding protein 4)